MHRTSWPGMSYLHTNTHAHRQTESIICTYTCTTGGMTTATTTRGTHTLGTCSHALRVTCTPSLAPAFYCICTPVPWMTTTTTWTPTTTTTLDNNNNRHHLNHDNDPHTPTSFGNNDLQHQTEYIRVNVRALDWTTTTGVRLSDNGDNDNVTQMASATAHQRVHASTTQTKTTRCRWPMPWRHLQRPDGDSVSSLVKTTATRHR